ncbi:hypothetical protein HIM_12576 [Hirsutella minnesotensis 3608]|uniref:Uncharacterized protein n=1 Tax=Hirsutella minnesotensis 3608 TaxID=1043627 RepID=A0A0F7ZQK7_9HYPO|nr:hypothetical protein HIM_12576 [Hirsutella minnesotensis 3608]
MARKKVSELAYPGRSHPTLTAEDAKERERQRQGTSVHVEGSKRKPTLAPQAQETA